MQRGGQVFQISVSQCNISYKFYLFGDNYCIETVIGIKVFFLHIDHSGFDDFGEFGGRDSVRRFAVAAFDFDKMEYVFMKCDNIYLTETGVVVSVENLKSPIL